MALEVHDGGPPLSEDDLASVERRLGFPLPKAYRAFLLKNNGGRPRPGFFPVADWRGGDSDHLQLFFKIGGEIESLRLLWNYEVFRRRMPAGCLPIGITGCGDILCLALRGIGAGRVFLWDHEQENVPPTHDNMYHVAQSFEELLASFHDQDLSAEVARLVAGARVIKKPN